ncbi:hypothetical protein AGABI2DRAFT_218205 [Agaricus bisporus var. bisporus H97]|uniref:hypothetical protein n=1 Tax=Agaricus bisporus var. bisporus (strain H97 / ATCC MYA-4626 / FGSC 10389) TaxID=936046 RepID=UPI00029F58CC|nr:hypothetical protein AGABI2DRAFT_218205 [Agaricus bisporus var. bisporus H97]EKV49146.1 hypothetical protein AGABI2DRAFT_218205 [Agaricus bisporus var. bisporus H97]
MSSKPQIGTLVVVILKARNLIDRHSFYKQDVFAQACLNGTSQKTQVDRKGGQHPLWDTELRFPIMKEVSDQTRKLEVACFAKEHRTDDLLGKGVVDITETLQTGEFDDWASLNIDGVERGEVYLEMTYFSSRPPPKGSASSSLLTNQNLTRRPSKLPASERLWRPPQTQQPALLPSKKGHSSHSVSAEWQTTLAPHPSPKNAPLPPLPKEQLEKTPLPDILLPGGSIRPQPGSTTPPSVPGIGSVPALPTSGPMHRPSPSPPLPSSNPPQTFPSYATSAYNSSGVSSAGNPYLTQPTITPAPIQMTFPSEPQPNPVTNHPHYGTMPIAWDQNRPDETGFSFPVPAVAYGERVDPWPTDPQGKYEIHQAVRDRTSISWSNSSFEGRYREALPLPQESQPTKLCLDNQPVLRLDADRLHGLKLVEEGAARRKEQEQRDLEIALKLDKELNT